MPLETQPPDRKGQSAAEQLVREIGARSEPFVATVEATRVPMVVTDPALLGNPVIYVNAAFLELSGYASEEVLGQNYFFLVGEHAGLEAARRVEAAMAARRTFIKDVPFRLKDGREAWVSSFVSPVV